MESEIQEIFFDSTMKSISNDIGRNENCRVSAFRLDKLRMHPLRHERCQRKKYGIHPASFRFANVPKRSENKAYQAVAIFPNHQVIPGLRQIPYTTLRQAHIEVTLVDTKIAAHALHGKLVAAGLIA